MAETIKAVKGFNQNMTCTPTDDVKFQYEEGKTYEEEVADVCNKGFHACELPMDAFRYYPPVKSVYHEVEMSGKIDDSESDKVCSSKIKIGAKINIAGIIKASVDIIKNKAEKESAASSGDKGNAVSSGYCGTQYLLGTVVTQYLLGTVVLQNHIIKIPALLHGDQNLKQVV